MAQKKNKNARKYAAVALGIIGVAGLSLASASQLTVTTDEIAVGSKTFAACDTDGINVAYTTGTIAGGLLPVTGITVGSGTGAANQIAAACAGKTYSVTILNSTGGPVASQTYTGTFAAGTVDFSQAITPTGLTANQIYGVAITIK